MRKLLLGFAVVLVVCVAAYLRFHHTRQPLETAYAGGRQVILWNTSAEIREPVATVGYGDRLDVLERYREQARVRTAKGLTGWVAQSDLLSADLWQTIRDLEAKVAASPVEASGHTRVISNLHAEPGRDSPRVHQLSKTIPLDLFERQAVEAPLAAPVTAPAPVPARSDARETAGEPPQAKKEDWWLVRAHLADQSTVAGWILGRFVDLDVPSPLPDYASSAGMHIAAWFELNRVADLSGGAKAQYLLVGTRGPEGQPCDFTQIRVYTWAKQGQRYETAFVGSDVCGKLPVRITRADGTGGDVTFAFEDSSTGGSEERTYRMHQTVVRRVREPGQAPARRKRNHG